MSIPTRIRCAAAILPFVLAPTLAAQEARAPIVPLRGNLERVTVHGRSLEGNLEGDTPDRPVSVYLPPSYATSPDRRYPVVYVLHGFTDSDLRWFGWQEHFVNVPAAFERALAAGTVREMILVMPNAYTAYAGSMYSSSVTTGDWETYVADELVSYIDAHYRTIAEPAARGLTGHSMGGYGTIRIAMKRPGIFTSIYLMSACCMNPRLNADGMDRLRGITSIAQVDTSSFGTKIVFASAAAWSPNPDAPPLYLDLPIGDESTRLDVLARWAANAPLSMVHQYVPALRSYSAIAMDSGAQDRGIAGATRELDRILTTYGIDHSSEIYDPGDHVNRVGERVEKHVLPFFDRTLRFATGR